MITVTITVIFTVIRSSGALGALAAADWFVGGWRANLIGLHENGDLLQGPLRGQHPRGNNRIAPIDGRQDRLEDSVGFLHQNKQIVSSRTVQAGLDGALAGSRPTHQNLGGPMGLSQLVRQSARDDRRIAQAAIFTVISSWKLLARFRQHFSAPPRLQCRREEREMLARATGALAVARIGAGTLP
jgi:hypothetical protein